MRTGTIVPVKDLFILCQCVCGESSSDALLCPLPQRQVPSDADSWGFLARLKPPLSLCLPMSVRVTPLSMGTRTANTIY